MKVAYLRGKENIELMLHKQWLVSIDEAATQRRALLTRFGISAIKEAQLAIA